MELNDDWKWILKEENIRVNIESNQLIQNKNEYKILTTLESGKGLYMKKILNYKNINGCVKSCLW